MTRTTTIHHPSKYPLIMLQCLRFMRVCVYIWRALQVNSEMPNTCVYLLYHAAVVVVRMYGLTTSGSDPVKMLNAIFNQSICNMSIIHRFSNGSLNCSFRRIEEVIHCWSFQSHANVKLIYQLIFYGNPECVSEWEWIIDWQNKEENEKGRERGGWVMWQGSQSIDEAKKQTAREIRVQTARARAYTHKRGN